MNNGTLYVRGEPSTYLQKADSAKGRYSVFISHQNHDSRTATHLARRISLTGPPCYIDRLDPKVDGDKPELESYLRDVIRNCRALLAVVSENTSESWWVPLEIGVALENDNHIGTFELSDVELPSYLWQWPVMDNVEHTIRWANATVRESAPFTHRRWRRLRRRQRQQRNAFFDQL